MINLHCRRLWRFAWSKSIMHQPYQWQQNLLTLAKKVNQHRRVNSKNRQEIMDLLGPASAENAKAKSDE